MKIEDLYKIFRFIAAKRYNKIKNKSSDTWKDDWSKLRWMKTASNLYEDLFSSEFREKQEKISQKGLKATISRLDYMLCWFFLGAVPEDYFSMIFENKGWRWRNHHITRTRLEFLKSKFNSDDENSHLVNDKVCFCNIWEDMLHRKWCDPNKMSINKFKEEFKDIDKVIVKPTLTYGGKGIEIFDLAKSGHQKVYDEVLGKSQDYIIEEYHNQTGWLNEVNPSSLNTIRLITLQIKGEIKVIAAYLRVGVKGSFVDNLHSGGIRFPINHKTGVINPGMNYQSYDIEKHPDTEIQLAGEVMPKWDEIVNFCIKAHERAPDNLRMIGWDVCLDEDDLLMIEANLGPGFPPIDNPKDDWWESMKQCISELER